MTNPYIVHQCTKFGCKRTQHRQVTHINNDYKFLLPEAVCCCLQTCNVYIKKLAMCYIHIPSFIILGSCIYGLRHINGLYHNVWPRANSCHFLLLTSKQNCLQKKLFALARPIMDSNHHSKFQPSILYTPVKTEQQQQQDNPSKLSFLYKSRTDFAIFTIFGVHGFFDHTNWANLSKVGSDS